MSPPLSRRTFLHAASRWLAWMACIAGPLAAPLGKALAAGKRKLLPADTPRGALANMVPSLIDARRIAPTPLAAFRVMGTDDYKIDIDKWRLEIVGAVKRPMSLTFADLLRRPVVARKVLLICPLVFANQGYWKGVAIWPLLQAAGVADGATHLVVSGPEQAYPYRRRFPLADVRDGKLFLSYEVNGKPLPVIHGYPLRLVADDAYGDRWVKYVCRLEVVSKGGAEPEEGYTPGL